MKILQGTYLTPRDKKIINTFVSNNIPVGGLAGTPQITFKLLKRDNNRLTFKRYQIGGWATAGDRNGRIIEVLV